jgi:hypothetical protein
MPHKRRLSALISKGYFPKELPPTFTTESFGAHVNDVLNDWKAHDVFSERSVRKHRGRTKRGSYLYQLEHTEAENISKPKRGYERRSVQITHPIPQAVLSYELAKSWKTVQKWLVKQAFSLDQIQVSDSFSRSIKGINFEVHRAKKSLIEATADWIVKTDISRFYPTIYTHSIPWAAYGKEKVKQQLKLYDGSLADRLDLLVRACNRNQTVGIPIGPETSRILAEIISSRIDADFRAKAPEINRDSVDRLQDDWFVGLSSLEQAETVLSKITSVYRHYGLEINGSKTSIARVIGHAGNHWISELGAFLSHRPGPIQGARLREFLSLALRMQAAYPADAVTSYVLTILESQQILAPDVEALESYLLKAAANSPISMSSVSRILINVQHTTKRLSLKRITERFTSLAEINLANGNLYEVIWLLYTLRGLGAKLNSKKILSIAENYPSSALALTLLDMSSRGLCVGKLPKNEWASQITVDRIESDWIWLLAYEGIRHGWLPDTNNVMATPFFSVMNSRGIEFYDVKRNIPSSKKVLARKRMARRRDTHEAKILIEMLRGFAVGDYLP